MSSSWTCPYCNQIATITESNVSVDSHFFNNSNKSGGLSLRTNVVVCPNDKCREYVLQASLHEAPYVAGQRRVSKTALMTWQLKPQSSAKPIPEYVPAPIRQDYEEACLIVQLSPKASATLSRRCLQGMIRDFWGISMRRLYDEIQELKGKVASSTWQAIDAVRSIGNIGAHMEQDINVIVDVEPGEAELLIKLIESLIGDWYIQRSERNANMEAVVAVAKLKADSAKAVNDRRDASPEATTASAQVSAEGSTLLTS